MCRPPRILAKVKVVGTFHVPSTWNLGKSQSSRHIPCAVHLESWVVGAGKSLTANGTAEPACTLCLLCPSAMDRTSQALKQELDDLDVTGCFGQIFTPGV